MTNRFAFRQHPLYKFLIWLALAGSLILLWRMNSSILSDPKYIPVDDFSHYWAAGRLNTQAANPYDPEKVQGLRNAITGSITQFDAIPINWTPPWSLVFLMPYGILTYPLSRLAWLVTQVTVLLACANLTWKIYDGSPNKLIFAWILTFIFGPSISVLEKGQITPLVVLGIVGFLYFITHRKNAWLVGLCLVPISLKPQLFYLLWPAIFLWMIENKEWRIVLGALLGFGTAILIPTIWNPTIMTDYTYALFNYPPTDWATPTLGGYLRLVFGMEKFWLQFIPPIIGGLWFIYFWRKNHMNWDWSKTCPSCYFFLSSRRPTPGHTIR
jgi:hypothetical protein